MYELTVFSHFDAAHFLKAYKGKCAREHGHRWKVEICLKGEMLDSGNMLMDFSVVKKELNSLLDLQLDHYQLNTQLCEDNPTAEYLARYIFHNLTTRDDKLVKLAWVCVWESPECGMKFYPTGKEIGEINDHNTDF